MADWLCHLVTIFLLAEIIAADAQVAQGHLVPSVSFFEIILYCKTHLGAFKLDHLQPVKAILFSKFYNFSTFIMGANSYYPRGLIMGKGKFFQLPI